MSTMPTAVPLRTRLHADPAGVFLHDAVLAACRKFGERTAIVDTSCDPPHRISYAEYGALVERCAQGFVAAGIHPGEVIGIYLPNCWEFAVAYHAATLAGAIPTLLNPSYREREVFYQLANSGAVALLSDGPKIRDMNFTGLLKLRRAWVTREHATGADPFSDLFRQSFQAMPKPSLAPETQIAVLPYSSGTTGLPKGVMLTHFNLVANVYQVLAPGEEATYRAGDVLLTFLPLYHIYGLNVLLNPGLESGCTLVLMPRFELQSAIRCIVEEGVTVVPMVPPVMNAVCLASEQGAFPREHGIRAVKCGAAPLPPELPKRFTDLTGIPVRQGYGMTEASPVTHLGFIEPQLYQPDSIGHAVARTDCRIVDESGNDTPAGEPGELVMRGPQFMSGYWNAPEATAEVLRDGWYWSGDVAVRDSRGFYRIVDRRKEMIKYKGLPIAPAEVEAVLMEHPAVRDCGVVGRKDGACGEIPVAFIVLREGYEGDTRTSEAICGYAGVRLSNFKQPREVRFVPAIPRNPSGKILRRELRNQL